MADIDRTLLKTQRNRYFNVVKAAGFNPADFNWTVSVYRGDRGVRFRVSVLQHEPSTYHFSFNPYSSEFSPDDDTPRGFRYLDETAPSELDHARLEHFTEWLTYLRREATTPDLWEQARTMRKAIYEMNSGYVDNSLFTDAEHVQLSTRLVELAAFIQKTQQLEGEQLKQLNSRIEYLQESSTRLGRKDWLNIFIAVLFSLVVSGIFAPDRAQELFQFAMGLIQPVYGNVLKLAVP